LPNLSSLGARQQAYTLLNSYLYSDSLDRLQKLEIKSTSDWLAIASIYSNNGKAEDSIAALKSALEQSPADKNILQKLAMQTKELGGEEEAKLYTNRLEELKFNNY
jgi:predicted Zn-dependent protease